MIATDELILLLLLTNDFVFLDAVFVDPLVIIDIFSFFVLFEVKRLKEEFIQSNNPSNVSSYKIYSLLSVIDESFVYNIHHLFIVIQKATLTFGLIDFSESN